MYFCHERMEKEIYIDNLKIAYEETGDANGAPVLILHGWGCNHNTVKSIANCLNDKMRVISIDLPGHGSSGEPEEVWGTFDFAEMLDKFIKALNLTAPSLIGHSFGGRTSIAYASLHPITQLVLVDSSGITPKRSLKYYWKVYSYKFSKKLVFALFGEKKGKAYIEKMLKKKASADYQAASPKMRAIMSKCINEDLRNVMPSIKCPTLMIWGENDTATPLSDAKIMENKIKDSGIVSFPNCGHYSFLDNPFGFKAVIREFFKNQLTQPL